MRRRNPSTYVQREAVLKKSIGIAHRVLFKRLRATRKRLIDLGAEPKMARQVIQQIMYKAIGV